MRCHKNGKKNDSPCCWVLDIRLDAVRNQHLQSAPMKLLIYAAVEVIQSTIQTRGVLMRVLSTTEIESVAGGNDFLDRMIYGVPGVVLHDQIGGYWEQQWALWGPNRIGGYPQ
jgi:hypothetical protein